MSQRSRSCVGAALAVGASPAAGMVGCREAGSPASPPFVVPVEYHKLSNGLRVVLSRDTTAPLVRVGVYYAVGPRQEPRERAGFAHLFEHLMFEGSPNLGPGEYFKLVTGNGGRFGARTLYDFTKFNATVPSHVLELLLWAEADRMRGIRVDPTRFQAARDVVKNEIRQQAFDRPYGRFVWIDVPEIAQTKWENAHSIYGETADGSMAAIDAATLEDARAFFQSYYSPDNAALAIYGDFDPALALQWVRQYFGDIPRGPSRPHRDLGEPRQETERRVTRIDANAPRPALAIAYHAPPPRSPQYWAMGVIDQILVHGRDGWMNDALVRRLAITDDVDAGISARHGSMYTVNGPNFWTAFAYFDRAQSPDSVLAAMDQEIERLRSAPVDEETLTRAITKARAGFYGELNAAVGEGRTDMLGQLALFDDDPERINRIEAELRRVTPTMILATAREYLRPSNRTVLTLQAGTSTPRRFVPPRAVESSLSNGLTLTLVPYGTTPTARVELVIRAGTADEPAGQVGIAELVADYLREGSRARSADSLAREASVLGVVGGEIGTRVRPFETWVGGEVLSESAPALAELIGELVQQPAFAPEHLARLEANQVRRLSARRMQPATLASTRVNTLLFPNHPSDRIPTDEQVKALTLDDVRRFHATHFVARQAHLYVAGVFDAPAVEAAVRGAFGAWTPGDAKPRVPDTPLERGDARTNQRPVIHLLHRPGASQARIQVSTPVVDPAHPDHPVLNLLNIMLGSVQTSRIIANVRERHGYSYNVSSRLVRRPGSSQWALTADVAKDVTGAALREILAELARVVAEPPSDEELRRHQAFMAGVLIAENATPAGILDTLRYFDLYGVDAEYRAHFVDRVRDIVPADIHRVARTYFQPRDLVIVVVGDQAAVASQLASVGTIAD